MVEFTGDNLLFIVPIAAVIALVVAFLFFRQIFSKDKGTPEMQAISDKIEEGAMAYLARQYKTIAIIAIVIAVIIAVVGFVDDFKDYLNYKVAIAFVLGAGCSILSGFIGMKVSVNSNIRTSAAATRSLGEAFQTSFRGGAISGLAVSVLSLAGLFIVFFIYSAWCDTMTLTLHSVVGFAFGASMAALFAQLGGGIYTKAADVGADLVGKVEAGIPEDDPRNPAVIADLVGDNVGDCAGRGADIFESTAAEIIGSMVIGLAVCNLALGNIPELSYNFIYLPLVIMAFGLLASLVGIFCVRLKNEDAEVIPALNLGYYITMGLVIVTMIFACYWLLKDVKVATIAGLGGMAVNWWMFAIAGLVGIALGLVVVYVTQYYTGDHKPVKTIAQQSESGPATNVIMGLSVGLESTVIPVVCIGIAIVATYLLGFFSIEGGSVELGLYGTAIATVSMLASSAFILAEDTFGPITDNAGGIAEMSNQPEEVRNRTDKLDAVGNTTKALTKGYAMSSAALAAFLLFAAFFEIIAEYHSTPLWHVSIMDEMSRVILGDPLIFVGGLIGAALVFFFASLAIRAVGTAAGEMVQEVREQFADGKIMAGEKEPEYGRCVDIATQSALKQMVVPALLPILTPVVFGLLYRYALPEDFHGIAPYAVGGLIMVATIVGILMANFLNNGGGAWDNAKKYIEEGNHGGKKSPAHAAAVVGDTVGDPFKDTAGPSIHVLVKLLSTICLVTAVLYVA